MDFMQLLGMLQNPGEEGPPETIYDDLTAAYNSDLSVRDAAVTTHSAQVEELQAELLAAKAHNYELLMQIGAQDTGIQAGDDDGGDDDGGDDEGEQGTDSLFEDNDKEDEE